MSSLVNAFRDDNYYLMFPEADIDLNTTPFIRSGHFVQESGTV